MQRTLDRELESRTVALVARAAKLVIEAALRVEQDVFEALQTGYRQRSVQLLQGVCKLGPSTAPLPT